MCSVVRRLALATPLCEPWSSHLVSQSPESALFLPPEAALPLQLLVTLAGNETLRTLCFLDQKQVWGA